MELNRQYCTLSCMLVFVLINKWQYCSCLPVKFCVLHYLQKYHKTKNGLVCTQHTVSQNVPRMQEFVKYNLIALLVFSASDGLCHCLQRQLASLVAEKHNLPYVLF